MSLAPSASVPGSIELPGAVCSISNELDSIETIMKQVADDRCGASTIFIGTSTFKFNLNALYQCFDCLGTTRNSFQGRAVNKLEYQGKFCESLVDQA